MNDYSNLQPKEVFKWFNEISMIPRCSGDEKRISDFLVEFAKERNLEYHQDKELNVIIKKAASEGYENAPIVIVQGHMDMVCEKSSTSNHDFSSDPILWKVEGDSLYAKDTTLGGDDGIAVAYCLALLDDDNLKHPGLEILITTNEETGMDGANAIEAEHLNGQILFNIDAEDEGIFLASCSGGANSFVEFKKEYSDYDAKGIQIDISGLLGGHSGMEIHKQRGNSIKIIGRILNDIDRDFDYRIVALQGGSKHNAIANNASCVIGVSEDDKESVIQKIGDFKNLVKSEYRVSDPDLSIEVEEVDDIKTSFTKKLTDRLVEFMMLVPYGVKDMSLDIEGLVQSSSNVGVILDNEDSLTFMSCVRSSVGSILHEQLRFIDVIAKNLNAKAWVEKEYPAWEFADRSNIRDLAVSVYNELYGENPLISAAHCGLETGIINAIKPGLDMISFGPDLSDVHTFNEHLSISSVNRVWQFTKHLLEKIK
jgi:dipeptidase D